MQKVLTAAQMREVDRLTTEKYGIPSILLMENAAHAVARVITEKLGGSVNGKSILILCGKGNNGGDGAALARILAVNGAEVAVCLRGRIKDTTGDVKLNFDLLKQLTDVPHAHRVGYDSSESVASPFVGDGGVEFKEFETEEEWWNCFEGGLSDFDVVVDAIFGFGFRGKVDFLFASIFEEIRRRCEWREQGGAFNSGNFLVVSVDIPSGISADMNEPMVDWVEADLTVTFTAPKLGNVLSPTANANGELIVAQIGSPAHLISDMPSQCYVAEAHDARVWLRESGFINNSYKNKRGHALLIAGSESYSGAAALCGNAAMRSGVGLVTVVTPKSSKDSVAARVLPEVMVRGVAETANGSVSETAFAEIQDLLEKADSAAIGSGISQDESTRKFVQKVIKNRRQPVIVDADALNLTSPFGVENHPGAKASPLLRKEGSLLSPLILTPHEGEFMRLLGTTDKNILKDRVAAVRDFATKHNVILVLKGERVLIGEPGGKVVVNPTGNSGLGKAGNGDTLTGILAGFVAQAVQFNIDIFETVVAAVCVAGMAGDIAEKKYGKRVMTASDVRECLTDAFRQLAGNIDGQ